MKPTVSQLPVTAEFTSYTAPALPSLAILMPCLLGGLWLLIL